MAAEVSHSPFELLGALDQRYRTRAVGLPRIEDSREEWTGVLFRLHGMEMLAPMDEVAEIVSVTSVAPVPGVKSWVLGIANMRGNLLPVMDLQAFLYDEKPITDPASRRLLVVSHEGVVAGLVIDAVMGMRHFWRDEIAEELPALDERIKPFVTYSFNRQGEHYPVFSPFRLAESEGFMNVTA
jgi:twitching motility protein PilI